MLHLSKRTYSRRANPGNRQGSVPQSAGLCQMNRRQRVFRESRNRADGSKLQVMGKSATRAQRGPCNVLGRREAWMAVIDNCWGWPLELHTRPCWCFGNDVVWGAKSNY